jgi:hypothetical protein
MENSPKNSYGTHGTLNNQDNLGTRIKLNDYNFLLSNFTKKMQ